MLFLANVSTEAMRLMGWSEDRKGKLVASFSDKHVCVVLFVCGCRSAGNRPPFESGRKYFYTVSTRRRGKSLELALELYPTIADCLKDALYNL